MNKLKMTMRGSKNNASCRMAFFRMPSSKEIEQIRAFRNSTIKGEEEPFWGIFIYYKNNKTLSIDRVYNTLSNAISAQFRSGLLK